MKGYLNCLKNRSWLVGATFAVAVSLPGMAYSSTVEVLDLKTYLEHSVEYHLSQQENQVSRQAEYLGLKQGQRYYWPEFVLRADYDEITNETDPTLGPTTRSVRSGVTSGVDATWQSLLGTDVTLGLEHQYGRQLGKTAEGIPEDELEAQTLSIEISQPLLKHNSIQFNRQALLQAREQWQRYETGKEIGRLTVLREALLAAVDVQRYHDQLTMQQNKLAHYRYLVTITEARVQEGQSLAIDLELAQLDAEREELATERARAQFLQKQRELSLNWVSRYDVRLDPYPSMSALIALLQPSLSDSYGPEEHPEYRTRLLDLNQARREHRLGSRDHWPELSAYYRYEHKGREALPNEESNSWGLRFSYSLFDLPTKERQARQGAQATIARWKAEDQLAQLQWALQRLTENMSALSREQRLHDQALELGEQALEHQLTRYRAGLSSYADVQQQQQALLDRQSERLTTQMELASQLIELAYYHQVDWIETLP